MMSRRSEEEEEEEELVDKHFGPGAADAFKLFGGMQDGGDLLALANFAVAGKR